MRNYWAEFFLNSLSASLYAYIEPMVIFVNKLGIEVLLLVVLFVLFLSMILLGWFTWNFYVNKSIEKRLKTIRKDTYTDSEQTTIQEPDNGFISKEALHFLRVLTEKHDGRNPFMTAEVSYSSLSSMKISENSYHEFAELLPDIVFECNREGTIIFLNSAGRLKLGIEKRDWQEQNLSSLNFIHADDQERAKNNLINLTENKLPDDSEYKLVDRDKNIIYALAYSVPVLKNGEVASIRGLLVDVSYRKKNEQMINMLHDLVSHVDLGINVFKLADTSDPMSFTLEMVNEASQRLMRFSNQENIGKTIEDISPLFLQKKLHDLFIKVVKTGKLHTIDEFEYQPDPSKQAHIFNLRVFPLPQNRVALLVEDIMERKKAQQTLIMTSFGLENAGDIILWLDEEARILYANSTACLKYGYDQEELLRLKLINLDTRITKMQWYELLQILETKSTLTMESINTTTDDKSFPVELSINKFVYSGKNYYFAFIRDISDRKKNDELEQKIQIARKSATLKQQFLANMSHEIRTPMTGIMGMTSLLMRTQLSPAQMEYVRNIKISSENLLSIINDVLDLSKIEAGKMELKPQKIDFREFTNEFREVFQHQAQSKGIRFSIAVEPLIPVNIVVDDQRLKQVINNLLSNAFKFTDEGEVSIRFELGHKKEDVISIHCQVKDTGMGIGEENQKQIFEKFTQVDSSLIRPFEGTGLGLAICRELVQLMGGEIGVTSQLGRGSTFFFTFKAKYDKEQTDIPEKKSTFDYKELKLNVLHVEDKLLNQKVVGFILFNAGCNVDFAKNGKEAVEQYQPGKYDIILMDIQMPVMDGISAYKELRKKHGDKLCPVIGLSANAMEGDAQKYMDMGLNDYIVKPFQPSVLYEKVLKWSGKVNS